MKRRNELTLFRWTLKLTILHLRLRTCAKAINLLRIDELSIFIQESRRLELVRFFEQSWVHMSRIHVSKQNCVISWYEVTSQGCILKQQVNSITCTYFVWIRTEKVLSKISGSRNSLSDGCKLAMILSTVKTSQSRLWICLVNPKRWEFTI